jgi:hydroxymethylpyrimidine/phosphomethylpyrimidine kinase
MTPAVALTIAGSDSSGGAGIQADLKTFAAFGVYGTSAITALTAQNTRGVFGVQVSPVPFVVAQIEAVLDDLDVRAVKTGMLATAEIVDAVAALAAAGRLPRLVVDPVMVASSGDRLLAPAAEQRYVEALFPHALLVTPNRREAEALLDTPIRTLADQHAAARALGAFGCRAAVVTGGDPAVVSGAETTDAVDVVWDGATTYELRSPRVDTPNNHGTGCTFAAATAAALARGADLREALAGAKSYVERAVRGGAGWHLGGGHGPLDHFAGITIPSTPVGSAR